LPWRRQDPLELPLRITKTNVTIGQQDLSRRCEDDGHPWSSPVSSEPTHAFPIDQVHFHLAPLSPWPVPKRHLGGYHRFTRPEVRGASFPLVVLSFRDVLKRGSHKEERSKEGAWEARCSTYGTKSNRKTEGESCVDPPCQVLSPPRKGFKRPPETDWTNDDNERSSDK
jgi:hypothetical protein